MLKVYLKDLTRNPISDKLSDLKDKLGDLHKRLKEFILSLKVSTR